MQISRPGKLLYSLGGLGMNLANLVISQWLYKFYVTEGHMASAVFAAILILGRVMDVISDPLVAYWSDHARSRFGRRRPFLIYGLVPFGLVIFLLWLPPVEGLSWINNGYGLILLQAYFLLYTVVVTPYLALLPEITPNRKDRVNITTYQAIFTTVGTIVFALLGILIDKAGYPAMGLVVALLAALSFFPTIFAVPEPSTRGERGAATSQSKLALFKDWLLLTLKNRPFVYIIASTSLYWFALNTLLILVPVWVEKALGLKEDAVTLIMGPFLLFNVLFFVGFNMLAKARGKYIAFMTCLGISSLTFPLLALVGTDLLNTWIAPLHAIEGVREVVPDARLLQSILVVAVVGIPVAGFLMLPFALLSDAVDYDEKRTGKRREAIFFGSQAIFQKSMIAVSIGIFALFDLRVEDGYTVDEVVASLKLTAVIAGIACGLAFLSFLGYPLRESDEGPDVSSNAIDQWLARLMKQTPGE